MEKIISRYGKYFGERKMGQKGQKGFQTWVVRKATLQRGHLASLIRSHLPSEDLGEGAAGRSSSLCTDPKWRSVTCPSRKWG